LAASKSAPAGRPLRGDATRSCHGKFASLLALIITFLSQISLAQTFPATLPTGPRTDFLAMGDWGEGKPAQKAVANALAAYAQSEHVPFTGMLLAGDNFYVKLPGGAADPQWQTLFEKMYDPARLPMPFYVSLGNHDYDGRKDIIELQYAALHPDSRWKFPARHYRIDLPAEHPMVTLIMLDSNKQVLSDLDWADQRRWLDAELAKPRTTSWVICCAHHPLFSNGVAGNNGVLQRDWGTLFKKYHVDFYLCGHEHNLQHLEIPNWPISFVMCGGGGAHASPMLHDNLGPFSRTVYGFAHFTFTAKKAVVAYIGTDDKPLHVFERTKAGVVTTLMTTPSDTPVDKPLELIQGLYDKIHGPATQPATLPTSQP
jgi:tartrate-resistant acid phosphatase type 5